MRIYKVTVGQEGGTPRILRVPSKTDVQAGDAAVALMTPLESILSIEETDDPYQQVDGMPTGTQTHPDKPA
ncbi:MAG: hypothetical protein DI531_12780 [Brevundimonas sp.]|uniref:hypothetical protein n=1 Tax=Brevundimonas sp. TaxID=1871086 RepID=UPI000DB57F9A|nr:hypothetical protein [Brevundimonas sp.]PZU72462.1 MAG: hypothetical protein DI531_12780 [Brevundimonas sp.]